MRILLVAFSNSIHTARWLSQVSGQDWDIHLFPSIDCGEVHSEIRNVTVHHSFYEKQDQSDASVRVRGIPVHFKNAGRLARRIIREKYPHFRAKQLSRLIRKIKPDCVHSMEMQHGGYLVLDAKKYHDQEFPPWIVTNWGSDIYLFGQLSGHESKVREVLESCDYYSCECKRDVQLATAYGFRGTILPVMPNTGGFDLNKIEDLREQQVPSQRRSIMLKGYQNWAGRALVGLRALERCSDVLKGYQVIIHTELGDDVRIAAELFNRSTNMPVKLVDKTTHEQMLAFYAESRISIGLSISDGISTSLLEAMAMGAFPIQSYTSCADEWLKNGHSGFLVEPNDPEEVEKAIRRALEDDALVDKAADINGRTISERLDWNTLSKQANAFYNNLTNK